MPRIPPAPGLIGVDFGYKPAIFLARTPFNNAVMNQQTGEEDEPFDLTCFEFFGPTMEVTLTGISVCGCFEANSFSTPPAFRYYTPVISSGVNGVFTLTNGVGPGGGWAGVIGVITLQESTFGGGTLPASTCPGTPIGDPFDVNVDMTITCDDTTHKLMAAATITLEGGSPGVSSLVFTTGVTPFSAGAVAPSVLDCTDIDPDGYYRDAAGFGNLTVTPPP